MARPGDGKQANRRLAPALGSIAEDWILYEEACASGALCAPQSASKGRESYVIFGLRALDLMFWSQHPGARQRVQHTARSRAHLLSFCRAHLGTLPGIIFRAARGLCCERIQLCHNFSFRNRNIC